VRWFVRCPFCDFLARPASLKSSYRRMATSGTREIRCPLCNGWYEEGEMSQVQPVEAFLAAAHAKLGFPNLTVDKLRRIILFVSYEHHLINCDGDRDEWFGRYWQELKAVARKEMLSEMGRIGNRSVPLKR